jgi:hypothetical protein
MCRDKNKIIADPSLHKLQGRISDEKSKLIKKLKSKK